MHSTGLLLVCLFSVIYLFFIFLKFFLSVYMDQNASEIIIIIIIITSFSKDWVDVQEKVKQF